GKGRGFAGGDDPRLLQNADVLLHPRERHVELLGKVRDRGVCTPELLQHAASGGIRERGERGIEAGPDILNHLVQYIAHGLTACKGRLSGGGLAQRRLRRARFPRATSVAEASSRWPQNRRNGSSQTSASASGRASTA